MPGGTFILKFWQILSFEMVIWNILNWKFMVIMLIKNMYYDFKTWASLKSISFIDNSSHPSQNLTPAVWQVTLHHQVQDQMASVQLLSKSHQAAQYPVHASMNTQFILHIMLQSCYWCTIIFPPDTSLQWSTISPKDLA